MEAVSRMVELECFRSLLSEEKQEKKGLVVQANDISALASHPRPWKMLCLPEKDCRVMLRVIWFLGRHVE